MSNKVYILQKDLPDAKAGAEFKYDGGTCYSYNSTQAGGLERFYENKVVENSPEWFLPKQEERPKMNTEEHGANPIDFDLCMDLINKSIAGIELTSEFVKLPQLEKIISFQIELKNLLPPTYQKLLIQELFKNNMKSIYIGINDVCYELTSKIIDTPKEEKITWWNFLFKNKK